MEPLKSMKNMVLTIREMEYTGYIVLGYNNKTSECRFFTSDAFTYRGTDPANYYSSIKNIPLIKEREQADKLKAKLYRLYPRKKYGFTFSVMLNKKDVYYEAY